MKETTLLKTALICSLVGLIALYFISTKAEIGEYKPNPINKNIGEDVKLTGTITRISQKENVAFIELSHQSPITVVFFKENTNMNLKNGDGIEVIGEVQEYKGKNEVIAQKIRVIG